MTKVILDKKKISAQENIIMKKKQEEKNKEYHQSYQKLKWEQVSAERLASSKEKTVT